MRQWGRLSLEVLFVGLLYTAVGIVLGVFFVGRGEPFDLLALLLQNLLALVPLVFFIWKAEGNWWSVAGTCALALAALQVVVPRLEMLLERSAFLVQLPSQTLHALGAGAAGAAALMLVLRSWYDDDAVPPDPWPAGEPVSYLWRLPALVAVLALLHVLAARLGRTLFGQRTHPPILDEFVAKVFVGMFVVVAAFALCAHLGVRSHRRVLVLLGVLAVLPAIGRWQLLPGWPAALLANRIGWRVLADLAGAVFIGRILLLTPRPSPQAPEVVDEFSARPDEKSGSGVVSETITRGPGLE